MNRHTTILCAAVAAVAVIAGSNTWATLSTARGFVGDTGSGWDTTSAVSVRGNAQHGSRQLINMIDGSGILAAGDLHTSVLANNMWLSSGVDPTADVDRFAGVAAGPWAEFDLGSDVELADMHIWNYGEASWPSWGAMSLKDVEILYTAVGGGAGGWGSDTFADWASLGGPRTLNGEMSGSCCGFVEDFAATDIIDFGGATARYVVILATNDSLNWNYLNGSNIDAGLSEVRFYPVPEPSAVVLIGLGGLLMLRRRWR